MFAGCGLFFLVVVASGCAPQRSPLYSWGDYQEILYSTWVAPGTSDPVAASVRLAATIERIQVTGGRVGPGMHAHLGWLYWQQGLEAEARAELSTESTLFPESTKLIDDMLARMNGAGTTEPLSIEMLSVETHPAETQDNQLELAQ
ncbi:MAG: hypothetical protein ACI8TX_002815 [Hyphomicrobiaceae bacterium]